MSHKPIAEGRICGAKTRSGTPCKRAAGHGTDHPGFGRCKLHGGSTLNHRKRGARLAAEHEMEVAVAEAREHGIVMGDPEQTDPHEALLECIAIAAGEVRYASERIAELEPDEAVGPVVTTHLRPRKYFGGSEIADDDRDDAETPDEERVGWVTEVKHEAPDLHIWIKVRHLAMDRLANYSRIAITVGIAERQVRIAEQQGQLLADAYRRFVLALGMDPAEPRVREAMRTSLTALPGGRAA